MEPPAPLRQFYDEIKGLNGSALEAHPAVIEPRKFLQKTGGNYRLRRSLPRSRELQHNYGTAQLACFDFVGYCDHCRGTTRHVHSIQGTSVYEIEGFPGVYVYPKLLRNYVALKDLIDQLLHRELASSDGLTNLHSEYHVKYPDPSNDHRTTSFFDPEASQLSMQPRLAESWVSFPITVQQFVQKLRWFRIRLPDNIKHLIEGLIPLQVEDATAHISSSQEMLGLRQHSQHGQHRDFSLDISLGCDGVVVLGRECPPHEHEKCGRPSSATPKADVNGYSSTGHLSNEDDDQSSNQSGKARNDTQSHDCGGFQLTALHLRHGDALLFCNEGMNTWTGIAKVEEGTYEPWEQDWPCWFEAGQDARRQEWRGCMRGRRLDLFIQ